MNRWRFLSLWSLFFVLALILSACGDGDAGSVSTTDEVSQTTSTAPATTTTTASATTSVVQVFFAAADQSDCSNVTPFDRTIPESSDPIGASFEELLAGPTAEEESSGAGSLFSGDTAGMLRSVTLTDGLLTVDFEDLRPVIPNASTSCGSASVTAQLNNTAFQFPDVERVTYSIEGSCDAFFNWMQTECQVYPRYD